VFKRFKNIKVSILILYLVITLAYPLYKVMSAPTMKLQVLSDVLFIFGLILCLLGVVFNLYLKGDFDITSFVFRKGTDKSMNKTFAAFTQDRKEKREESFNYPLFLGILYILVSVFIAYVLL
jgi:hypothetical protein